MTHGTFALVMLASAFVLPSPRPTLAGARVASPGVQCQVSSGCRLYVGGIPFGMTEPEVARIFDGLALPHEVKPVVEVCLVLGHDNVPRGYGFVELATITQAKRALALMDGRAVAYDGRMPTTLVVRRATPSATAQPRQLGEPLREGPRPIAGRVLWVGNLAFGTRPLAMRDAFAAAAGVPPESVRAVVARDQQRRSRGFGTVVFARAESAARALDAMRGAQLDGRALDVRIDRRAGALRAEPAAAGLPADAIDPGLLRGVESQLQAEEHEQRKEQRESRRQHEIERHQTYLSAVAKRAAGEKKVSKKVSKKKSRDASRAAARAESAHRVAVFNLPYSQSAAEQRRLLSEHLSQRPDLPRERLTNRSVIEELGGLTHASALNVWVGADSFGRSRGMALVSASSPAESWRVIEALDGCVLNGRRLAAREARTALPPSAGLPRFEPAWLARAREAAQERLLGSWSAGGEDGGSGGEGAGQRQAPPPESDDVGRAW